MRPAFITVDPREFRRVHGCSPSSCDGPREWLYEIRWQGSRARDWVRATYRGPYVGLLLTAVAACDGVAADAVLVILDHLD